MAKREICIIGAGPAGLAAAIAAHEEGCRDILMLERDDMPGGILNQCIHNGFGLHTFGEELTGPEYAERYINAAKLPGVELRTGAMVLDVSAERVVTVISREHGLEKIEAGAVILAMGCRERPRGAIGIPGARCAGIYTAGTAQRYVNMNGYMPGKRVVILGSGDIGLIMARRMTFEGAKVLACVEIMPYSGGLTRNIVQCLDDYGIPLMLSHTVVDIRGTDRLESVTVAQVDENRRPIPGTEQIIECDTLLLSVGLIPENELSRSAGVEIDPATSGAVVDQSLATSVEGIFACGNVLHVHDLVDNVSEESADAGRAAARYVLAGKTDLPVVRVLAGKGARSVVPQLLRVGGGAAQITLRPDRVYKKAAVTVTCGDNQLVRKVSPVLTPGEMITLRLPADKIADIGSDLTVDITEV